MSDEIQLTTTLVERISETVGDSVTDEQVLHVLAALNNVRDGDPLGTVKRNGEGAFAVRVDDNGLHKWQVTNPDGTRYDIATPTLPDWEYIVQVET